MLKEALFLAGASSNAPHRAVHVCLGALFAVDIRKIYNWFKNREGPKGVRPVSLAGRLISTIELALFELFARDFASSTHALTGPSELSVKTALPGGASWYSELAKHHKLPLHSPALKILAQQVQEDPERLAELKEEARQSRSQRNASSLEQQQTIEKKLVKLMKRCPPGHNIVIVSHSLNQQTFLGSGNLGVQRFLLQLGNGHLVPDHL
jgi:hypothetical protein